MCVVSSNVFTALRVFSAPPPTSAPEPPPPPKLEVPAPSDLRRTPTHIQWTNTISPILAHHKNTARHNIKLLIRWCCLVSRDRNRSCSGSLPTRATRLLPPHHPKHIDGRRRLMDGSQSVQTAPTAMSAWSPPIPRPRILSMCPGALAAATPSHKK